MLLPGFDWLACGRSHDGRVISALTLRIHYIDGRNGDTTGPVIVKLEQNLQLG